MEGTYLSKKAAAVEAGKVKNVTASIQEWKEAGTTLLGKITSIKPFTGGKYKEHPMSYTLDTDNGAVSCILGKHTDKQLKDAVNVGDIIEVTFMGCKSMDSGKRANIFSVAMIEKGDGVTPFPDIEEAATEEVQETKKRK